jgi:hypothetical protein
MFLEKIEMAKSHVFLFFLLPYCLPRLVTCHHTASPTHTSASSCHLTASSPHLSPYSLPYPHFYIILSPYSLTYPHFHIILPRLLTCHPTAWSSRSTVSLRHLLLRRLTLLHHVVTPVSHSYSLIL